MYFIIAEQDTVNALKNFQYAYEQDAAFYDPAEQICRIYAVQQPPFALDYIRNVQKNFFLIVPMHDMNWPCIFRNMASRKKPFCNTIPC